MFFIAAGKEATLYNTDRDLTFRQESNFWYLTGCDLANTYALFDADKKTYTLFVENLGEEYALWSGAIRSLEQQQKEYQCDKILFVEDAKETLKKATDSLMTEFGKCKIITSGIFNEVADFIKPITEEIAGVTMEITDDYIACNRLYKTKYEIENLKKACQINADSITNVLKNFRYDMNGGAKEYTVSGMYEGYCIEHGSEHFSFNTIAAVGKSASILHNMKNNKPVHDKEVFLLDVGCEINGYCSDHTRCFPTGTRFTPEQEAIYKIVLRCNKECIERTVPGAKWADVHIHSLRVLLEGLREEGLINKDTGSLEEQLELGIPSYFLPHGLGHLLGLTDHDSAGYLKVNKDKNGKIIGFNKFEKSKDFRLKYLRTGHVLEPNMCITVEPGCYFSPAFIERARNDKTISKHFNFEKIEHYANVCGGYRIEDDIIITETGNEILPAPVKELEDIYKLRDEAYSKKN